VARDHLFTLGERGGFNGFWMRLDNLDDAGRPTGQVTVMRAVRNWAGLHFEGVIHEGPILPAPSDICVMAPEVLRLAHLGYSPSVVVRKRKFERNTALLRRLLDTNPEDRGAHRYMGVELQSAGMLPEAVSHFRQALGLECPAPDLPWVWLDSACRLAECLRLTKRPAEAVVMCDKVLRDYPDYAELLLERAMVTPGYAEALPYFQAARTRYDRTVWHMTPQPELPAFAAYGAAWCCEQLGRAAEALTLYREAAADPDGRPQVRADAEAAIARLAGPRWWAPAEGGSSLIISGGGSVLLP